MTEGTAPTAVMVTTPGDRILQGLPRQVDPELGFENLPHKAALIAGALLGLFGAKKRGKLGLFAAGIGAGLLFQGARQNGLTEGGWKRHLFHTKPLRLVPFQRQLIIDRPVADVYRFWSNQENLAIFLPRVRDITPLDSRRSRWVVRLGDNLSLTWTAEILHHEREDLIVWRVQEPSDLYHEGWISFTPLRGGTSTMMTIKVYLLAPGGKLGARAVELLESLPVQFFSEDLERFRTIMEASDLESPQSKTTIH